VTDIGIATILSARFSIVTWNHKILTTNRRIARVLGAINIIIAIFKGESNVIAGAGRSSARINGAFVVVIATLRRPTASLLSRSTEALVNSATIVVITVSMDITFLLNAGEVSLSNESGRAETRRRSADTKPARRHARVDVGARKWDLHTTLCDITE
jgi:hypothetical protein